jgi:predicted GIY-YIG superfamily endonuclease
MAATKSKKKKRVKWLLYILKCGDGTLYTGITTDLDRRTAQHNNGTASRYTRSRLPVVVLHQEPCRDRSSALKKEYVMKQLSRPEKDEYIKKKHRITKRAKCDKPITTKPFSHKKLKVKKEQN